MSTDNDADFIAEALPTFISEAREQIEAIEQLLLQLEDDPADRDLLNALFRCAHTVKGSAGMFGLDAVVAFTHHVESLLDRMRDGVIALTPTLSTLLLQCNDQIRVLIDAADSDDAADEAGKPVREALVAQLRAALGEGGGADGAGHAQRTAAASAAPALAGPAAEGAPRWHVSAVFGADTFRNGMDPLALLNYLAGFGRVARIACDLEAIPALDALDAESCHLHLEFGFETAADRAQIESAFSFVREDCTLHLIEPRAPAEAYLTMLEALPDRLRLGEILVLVGAVTPEQLASGLDRQQSDPGGAARLGEILSEVAKVPPQVVAAALNKQQRQRDGDDQRFIRVQADRLDAVINLLGELVIAGAGAELLARQSRQGPLMEANQQITQLIEEIRNGTLQLRMVPIGEAFTRFRRVVRDTAAELGKDVALEIVGGETELDKSVVERIADPLMHLVRNALDHGLETPDARLAAGKPAQGRLTLSARHEAGSILIHIDDDGRGIDRDRVLARAWERGLVEPGVRPEDADILKLIFEPGFSTAEKVTNLSGRGVGMDVVKRNIEALRGSVTLSSEPGAGSRIEIRLPLTLAIIDGFLVGVGPSRFIFPLDAVVEVIDARVGAVRLDEHGRGMVELRGQVLPVVDLRTLYALDSAVPARNSIVVIRAGTRRYGVMVDQVHGQHQTVIKPLGRMFRSLRGMAGSSILGNGEVALIFDVNSLAQLASSARPSSASFSSVVPHVTAPRGAAHPDRSSAHLLQEGSAP